MTPKPLNLKDELREGSFRVTVFGSARIKPEEDAYKQTFELGRRLGEMDIDLITGGGPGLMEAASLGHFDGDKKGTSHSIGLNIRLPFEQKPNESLDLIETHERFSTRLDEFMLLSNAVVVMHGGVGTALEFFYTWQLIQVNHICKIPIILVGEMWHKLINWVIDEPLRANYLSSEDLNPIVCVDTIDEAMKLILIAKKAHEEMGDKACVNWKKYGKVQ